MLAVATNLYGSKCNSEICHIVFTSNRMKRLGGMRVSTFIYEYVRLAFATQVFYIEVAIVRTHRDGHYKPEGGSKEITSSEKRIQHQAKPPSASRLELLIYSLKNSNGTSFV